MTTNLPLLASGVSSIPLPVLLGWSFTIGAGFTLFLLKTGGFPGSGSGVKA